MGIVVVPVNLQYNVNCDLCGKPFKRLYPITIDDKQFLFCSGSHAAIAQKNWNDKKALGITQPDMPPNPIEEDNQYVGDNLSELD